MQRLSVDCAHQTQAFITTGSCSACKSQEGVLAHLCGPGIKKRLLLPQTVFDLREESQASERRRAARLALDWYRASLTTPLRQGSQASPPEFVAVVSSNFLERLLNRMASNGPKPRGKGSAAAGEFHNCKPMRFVGHSSELRLLLDGSSDLRCQAWRQVPEQRLQPPAPGLRFGSSQALNKVLPKPGQFIPYSLRPIAYI